MSSACSTFHPHMWKKTICIECGRTQQSHATATTTPTPTSTPTTFATRDIVPVASATPTTTTPKQEHTVTSTEEHPVATTTTPKQEHTVASTEEHPVATTTTTLAAAATATAIVITETSTANTPSTEIPPHYSEDDKADEDEEEEDEDEEDDDEDGNDNLNDYDPSLSATENIFRMLRMLNPNLPLPSFVSAAATSTSTSTATETEIETASATAAIAPPSQVQKLVEGWLKQANLHKAQGNDAFRQEKYDEAVKQYAPIFPLLDEIEKVEDVEKATDEQLLQCSELRLHATFNLCSTYFRQNIYPTTIEWAEKTLMLDPTHARARFRRAQATLRLPQDQHTATALAQCHNDLKETSQYVPASWDPAEEKRICGNAMVELEWKNAKNTNVNGPAVILDDNIDKQNPIYHYSNQKYSKGLKHVLDECYLMSTIKLQYFINHIIKQDNPDLQFRWGIDFDEGTFTLSMQDGRVLMYHDDEFQMIGSVDPRDHSFLVSYHNHMWPIPSIHTRAVQHLIETHGITHEIDEFLIPDIQSDDREELLSAYAIVATEHLLNKEKWRATELDEDDTPREWMFLGFANVRVCLLVPAFTHSEHFKQHVQHKFQIWKTIRGFFMGPYPIEIPCNKRRAFIHFWRACGFELKHEEKQDEKSGQLRHEICIDKLIGDGDTKRDNVSPEDNIPIVCQFDDLGRVTNQSYSLSMQDFLNNPNLFGSK